MVRLIHGVKQRAKLTKNPNQKKMMTVFDFPRITMIKKQFYGLIFAALKVYVTVALMRYFNESDLQNLIFTQEILIFSP